MPTCVLGHSRLNLAFRIMSGLPPIATGWRTSRNGRFVPILMQKSKVASVRIFGEILKREAIDDSDNLSRVTEVAYEFSLRRRGPSDFYTKTAPAALRIFDTFGKTTIATLSANTRHRAMKHVRSVQPVRRKNIKPSMLRPQLRPCRCDEQRPLVRYPILFSRRTRYFLQSCLDRLRCGSNKHECQRLNPLISRQSS